MVIRPAQPRDCADLAILDDIAGFGLPSAAWAKAATGSGCSTAHEYGVESHLGEATPCNWRNARIVEIDGHVAGMAIGYRLPENAPIEDGDDPVFRPVHELFRRALGSWLLDALAVYSRFRGLGAGRLLMRDQIERCEDATFHIVVANDNLPARALYRAHGFQQVDSLPFVAPPSGGHATREWLLLRRNPS
jgi:ribosomal protein S18 acetylase RimI-like enzyme